LRPAKGDLSQLSKEMRQRVERLDKAILKAPPIEKDIMIHRGRLPSPLLQLFKDGDESLAVGEKFGDDGFAPTSFAYGTAEAFGSSSKFPAKSVGTFRMPKGFRASWSEAINEYNEQEVLLPRGTRFRVTKAWKVKGNYSQQVWRVEGEMLWPEWMIEKGLAPADDDVEFEEVEDAA
jgi:hypothetical protein